MGFANYDAKVIMDAINNDTDRKTYFDGLGVNVQNAHDLETAIKLSGLDYEVVKRPVKFDTYIQDLNNPSAFASMTTEFPGQFVTIRTDTQKPLGVVGKNYNILQNRDAFDFLDGIIAGGAKFETAGTFKKNEAASFITVSTEPIKILDDKIDPYILLTNSFDGSGSVRVMFTPIRVFCSNCLALAIKSAHNKVNIRHSNSLEIRMEQAKKLLLANTNYLHELNTIAEKLAVTPFSEDAFYEMCKKLYPSNDGDSEIIQVRNLAQIEHLMKAYRQDDLQNFNNTAWKAVQAMADAESHSLSFRKTSTIDQKNLTVVMNGMPLLNQVFQQMMALAG